MIHIHDPLPPAQAGSSARAPEQTATPPTLAPKPAAPPKIIPNHRRAHASRVDTALLEIRCLGAFEVHCAGVAIPLHRHVRAQSVLKFLSLHRESLIQREVLVEAIWPDVPLSAGLDSLNTAVSTLRKELGCGKRSSARPLVRYRDGCYELAPDVAVSLDLDTFERAAADGLRADRVRSHGTDLAPTILAFEDAVRAYRGDLLPSDLYAEWTIMERERLLSLYLTILGRLSALLVSTGRFAAAIDTGFQLLQRDPCREDVHRLIMRSYSRMGQRSRALRHFGFCTASLREHLGIEPDAALVALHGAIASGESV